MTIFIWTSIFIAINWLPETTCIVSSSVSDGANVGAKIRITDKILPLLENLTGPAFGELAKSINGQRLRGKLDNVNYDLVDLQIRNYTYKRSNFSFVENSGINWKLSGLTAVVETPYKVSWHILYNTGRLHIVLFGVNMDITVSANSTDEGKLRPYLASCDTSVAAVTIEFIGGFINELLNMFQEEISEAIRQFLQAELCSKLSEELQNHIVKQIAGVPLDTYIFENLYLNYSLVDNPEFTANCLSLPQAGNVFLRRPNELADSWTPYHPPHDEDFDILATLTASAGLADHAVYLVLSNYTINTMLYFIEKYDILGLNFKPENLPEEFKKSLSVSCEEGNLCASLIFPSLPKLYPDHQLDFTFNLTMPPFARLGEELIEVEANAIFQGDAVNPRNNSRSFLFVTAVRIGVTIDSLKLQKNLFTAKAHFGDLTFSDVITSNPEFTKSSLDFILSLGIEQLIEPKINRLISENGIKLPNIGPLTINDGIVAVKDNLFTLAANFLL